MRSTIIPWACLFQSFIKIYICIIHSSETKPVHIPDEVKVLKEGKSAVVYNTSIELVQAGGEDITDILISF